MPLLTFLLRYVPRPVALAVAALTYALAIGLTWYYWTEPTVPFRYGEV